MQGLEGLYAARGYHICSPFVHLESGQTPSTENVFCKYLITTCTDSEGDTVAVFFVSDEPKLNVHAVKECLASMEDIGSAHAIIVYVDVVTPVVKKLIANSPVRIELFKQKELRYNIIKHELVPKHSLASSSEKKALEKYLPSISQMRTTDAVVRFMGFRLGDLVRIDRRDGSVAYRLVV